MMRTHLQHAASGVIRHPIFSGTVGTGSISATDHGIFSIGSATKHCQLLHFNVANSSSLIFYLAAATDVETASRTLADAEIVRLRDEGDTPTASVIGGIVAQTTIDYLTGNEQWWGRLENASAASNIDMVQRFLAAVPLVIPAGQVLNIALEVKNQSPSASMFWMEWG